MLYMINWLLYIHICSYNYF